MNAQFCTPASVTAPLYLKWALVFEDAQTHSIWLGKAIPRLWLRQGERVSAQAVPTGYAWFGAALFLGTVAPYPGGCPRPRARPSLHSGAQRGALAR